MTTPKLIEVTPAPIDTTRVFRQIGIDLETFDRFQDVKRFLEEHERHGRLSNAAVLRCIVMSHPEATEVSLKSQEAK